MEDDFEKGCFFTYEVKWGETKQFSNWYVLVYEKTFCGTKMRDESCLVILCKMFFMIISHL
jgi:hypothetical protein